VLDAEPLDDGDSDELVGDSAEEWDEEPPW
jgi:hypothetical protein